MSTMVFSSGSFRQVKIMRCDYVSRGLHPVIQFRIKLHLEVNELHALLSTEY